MATSEAEILEQYRIALHNARHQAAIAEILDEFGYGPDTLAVGDAKLAAARSAFDGSRTEKSIASAAHHLFSTKRDQLIDRYALDRRKARGCFRQGARHGKKACHRRQHAPLLYPDAGSGKDLLFR